MADILTQPHFDIDPRADTFEAANHSIARGAGRLCLEELRDKIDGAPDAFSNALTDKATADEEARGLVRQVVDSGLARFITYDAESDDAIMADPRYQDARDASSQARSYYSTNNGLGTKHIPRTHPEAHSRRSAVYSAMLTIYVERAQVWRREHSDEEA